MLDTVNMYPECYTYYLDPLIQTLRHLRDDSEVTTEFMRKLVLTSILPARSTETKRRFISRITNEGYNKLAICQIVENSCAAARKKPMIHY